MKGSLKLSGALQLGALAAAPTNPEVGTVYYDTVVGKYRIYDGSQWQEIADASFVYSEVNTITDNLSVERSARIAADSALTLADAAETSARIDGDAQLAADLAAEISARETAVAALQNSINNSVSVSIDAEVSARIAADNAEVSARIAADNAEQSARIAADNALQSAVDAEVSARIAADNALQSAIDAEQSARIAADNVEQSARIAADDALQSAVDAEVVNRGVAVSDEAAARVAADSVLQGHIDTEQSARIANDAITLSEANTYTDQKVAELVGSTPAVLDTLKELADALGNDPSLAATVAGQIGVIQDNLDAETSARIAADSTLTADLAAEVVNRGVAVSDEAAARIAADSALALAASAEQSARIDGDAQLAADLAAETSARIAADSTLTADLAAEVSRAIAEESFLASSLAAEVSNRTAAVSAEESARIAADSTLTSDLAAEVSNRTAAISAEESARIAADSTLTADLAAEVSRAIAEESFLASSLAAEQSARIAGDTQLTSDLAAEIVRATDAESNIQASIASEVSARITAIDTEASARQSADDALGAIINSEITSRTLNDEYLSAQITNLQSQVEENAISASNDIASETSARIAADSSFESALQAEVLQRIALSDVVSSESTNRAIQNGFLQNQVSALDTIITNEIADRQSANETLASSLSDEAAVRMAQDLNLQSQIDNIVSNVDPATLDSLSEIVKAFQEADSNLNQTIIGLGTSSNSYVGTERAERIAEDLTLFKKDGSRNMTGSITMDGNSIYGADTLQSQALSLGYGNSSQLKMKQDFRSYTLLAAQTDASFGSDDLGIFSTFEFNVEEFQACEITYTIKDSSGRVGMGTLRVIATNNDVLTNDSFIESDSMGISFNAIKYTDGASTYVSIRYSSGTNSAKLKANVKYINIG